MCTMNKKKCTEETKGMIVGIQPCKNRRRITVKYNIDGREYVIKEKVKIKSVTLKLGDIPVGEKKEEYITAGMGGIVFVKYNPNNPKKAYLRDNVERMVQKKG